MKKLFLTLPLAVFLMSCGGGCDNSTADGAADCYCDLMSEMKEADEAHDDEAMSEIDERGEKWEDEIESHMEAGDYTENDLESAMRDKNCR